MWLDFEVRENSRTFLSWSTSADVSSDDKLTFGEVVHFHGAVHSTVGLHLLVLNILLAEAINVRRLLRFVLLPIVQLGVENFVLLIVKALGHILHPSAAVLAQFWLLVGESERERISHSLRVRNDLWCHCWGVDFELVH